MSHCSEKNKNQVHFIKGDTVHVSAENDRVALQTVREYINKHMEDYSLTGDVRCLHYPAYEVDIFKFEPMS